MLSPGDRLGRYEVGSPLGAGGMGEVYRARDSELQRDVAVKILPEALSSDPDRLMRFEREAKVMAALSHPNVLSVFDVGRQDGRTYLVLEMLEGSTLAEVMRNGALRTREALDYAGQVARGLAAAHARGIVHRDLKPANLFLTTTGVVKVLDFGLARIGTTEVQQPEETTTKVTRPGVALGTTSYMSPEQTRGEPLDPRSDLFSLGTVLYEMLSGRHPFRRSSSAETATAILRDAPADLGRVEGQAPAAVKRLVGRCLEKRPKDRFQTANDLALALDLLGTGEDWAGTASSANPVAEQPGSGPATSAAPVSSKRRRGLVASLAGLLAMAAGAWLLLRPPPPPPRVVPVTSLRGSELGPSLSPDGEQVAFAWNGEKLDNFDIYLKMIGSSEVRRLTTDPAHEASPSWSPDGRQIAFLRYEPRGYAIRLVSPLGGSDRKLGDFLSPLGPPSWSPDGRWLAVARARPGGVPAPGPSLSGGPVSEGLYLVPVQGGEPRRIPLPPAAGDAIFPSFSPDGRQLAYMSCAGSCHADIVELGADFVPTGPPRRLSRRPILWAGGLAWTRDGKSLLFVGEGIHRLFRVATSGTTPPAPIELAGLRAIHPRPAASRDRLVFARELWDVDIYRFETGRSAEPVLASSFGDYGPSFSPDGRRVAFESERSGDAHEIWLAEADGSNSVQLTRGPGLTQGSPRWSPDGRHIAFDSQGEAGHWDIWTIDADGGSPRRLTQGPGNENVPSWSRDGRFVYFASRREGGPPDVWRIPAAGGAEERITQGGGAFASESIDGRTLLFTRTFGNSPLLALPLAGGPERQLVDCVAGFDVGQGGVYYRGCLPGIASAPLGPDAPFFLLDPTTGRQRLLGKLSPGGGLAVSPDGKTILFAKRVGEGHDLMMIENFR
jgi:serine/threonine protein kinase/dipeptidyl aminopeptidase/acylaminoacyl peptidase